MGHSNEDVNLIFEVRFLIPGGPKMGGPRKSDGVGDRDVLFEKKFSITKFFGQMTADF